MPIRINLLAEAQALEELRRRDPVKRAIWIGAFLVFLMLLWSSSLQVEALIAKGSLAGIEARIADHSKDFATVTTNKAALADTTFKLTALQQLATNRFLNGTMLNELQQTTVDDVQLIRFRADQRYDVETATPKKPATVNEHITLTLEARDGGISPGDQISRLKQAIATNPYFKAALGKTNEVRLTSFQPSQLGPDSKPFVPFTLECRFSDKIR